MLNGESFSPRERTRRKYKQSDQGKIDDEKSCFWTWDDNEYAMAFQKKFRTAKLKVEKLKAKVLAKAKLVSEELARHTLVKNRHKTLNGGQKKIVFSGPRFQKAGKVL